MLIPANIWLPVDSYVNIEEISASTEIKRGFKVYDEFIVIVPKGYWQKNIPEDKIIDSEFGSYQVSIDRLEEKYIIRREIIINKGFYERDSFELFNQFIKKVKRSDNSKIVLDSRT